MPNPTTKPTSGCSSPTLTDRSFKGDERDRVRVGLNPVEQLGGFPEKRLEAGARVLVILEQILSHRPKVPVSIVTRGIYLNRSSILSGFSWLSHWVLG